MKNSIDTDIRGLGTAVGGFSNCATVMYAMKGIFKKESQKEQKDELSLRIKLLREIVGQEIDRIKGTAAPQLPYAWKHFVRIEPEDSEETKKQKYKHNSLVLSKKPYFFRYLYGELNEKFKQYENMYNLISQDRFGIKFKKLLAKPDKTPEEMELVRRYQKYCPLITAPCTMNILCKEIENIDFDIKYCKNSFNALPNFLEEFAVDDEKLALVKSCYQVYCTKKALKNTNLMLENYCNILSDDYTEVRFAIIDSIKAGLQAKLLEAGIKDKEFVFYCSILSGVYAHFNWAFCWDMLEERVLKIIPHGRTFIPVEDENGVEYLGRKYVLKEIHRFEHQQGEQVSTSEINSISDSISFEDIEKILNDDEDDEDVVSLNFGGV